MRIQSLTVCRPKPNAMLLIFATIIIVYLINEFLKSINAPSVLTTLEKRNKQITKWLS